MIEEKESVKKIKVIPAKNARMFARLFNIGNLLFLLPGLVIAAIIFYIISGHHPNEVVGQYTQYTAYRYYGMIGVVIMVGIFFGTDWQDTEIDQTVGEAQ